MFHSLIHLIGTRWGRIGTGCAALAALAIGLWPWSDADVDIAKLLGFAGALAAWLFAELAGVGDPHPSDIRLFNRLMEAMPEAERRIYRDLNMGDPIPYRHVQGAGTIAETWDGAGYEFIDKTLNRDFTALLAKIRAFSSLFALNTGPMRGSVEFATVKTTDDVRTGVRSQQTLENAANLNAAATSLIEALDDFERLARRRLRV